MKTEKKIRETKFVIFYDRNSLPAAVAPCHTHQCIQRAVPSRTGLPFPSPSPSHVFIRLLPHSNFIPHKKAKGCRRRRRRRWKPRDKLQQSADAIILRFLFKPNSVRHLCHFLGTLLWDFLLPHTPFEMRTEGIINCCECSKVGTAAAAENVTSRKLWL